MNLLLLLLQIAVILVAARVVGYGFRLLRQPQVVGEMAAGILLGPSLLGWLAPAASAALFPPESLGFLGALSQVGLLLFMFFIGLELDPRQLRGQGRAALATSLASTAIPLALGAALALYLYPRLSDASVGFTGFALFFGAAMSATAFPVLARILSERNLLKTKLGAIAIACAAAADVGAWVLLAVVIAVVRAGEDGGTPLWVTLGGTAVYVAGMLFLARPLLGRLEKFYESRGRLTQDVLAVVLLALLASAWTTEWLGIHALFGAFVLGVVMPRERDFVRDVTGKLEDVTVVFLLPLFFAAAGLRTSVGLVQGAEMWGFFGLVMLVAVAGKFGGSTLAARLSGLNWREAGALGILMNTRGLMELVILTIGLDLGVISPALFAMMVLMALATTVMTTPILEWIYPARLLRQEAIGDDAAPSAYTVLIPVALPSSGPSLLGVAQALAPPDQLRVYALHLARAGEATYAEVTDAVQQHVGSGAGPLGPLLEAARTAPAPLGPDGQPQRLDVRPLSFVTGEPGRDIADVAHVKAADLVLMGWHKPIVSRSILGGTVQDVLRHTRADVAIYVARPQAGFRRVLVPFAQGTHDRAALALAGRLAQTSGAEVTILHVVPPERAPQGDGMGDVLPTGEPLPDGVRLLVIPSTSPLDALVEVAREEFDLVVVGASEAWGLAPSLFAPRHERLARECPASLLIVRAYEAPIKAKRRAARPASRMDAAPA